MKLDFKLSVYCLLCNYFTRVKVNSNEIQEFFTVDEPKNL